ILWRFLRRPFPWLRFSNRILSRGAFDLCFPGGLKLLFYLSRVPLRNRSIALRCVKRWACFLLSQKPLTGSRGAGGMNGELLWRFMDVRTRLITPICPDYAEMFGRIF
ncbi:unnamed protein product, partial [Musa banksii]